MKQMKIDNAKWYKKMWSNMIHSNSWSDDLVIYEEG